MASKLSICRGILDQDHRAMYGISQDSRVRAMICIFNGVDLCLIRDQRSDQDAIITSAVQRNFHRAFSNMESPATNPSHDSLVGLETISHGACTTYHLVHTARQANTNDV